MREFKTAHDFRRSLESKLQSYAKVKEIDYQRVRIKVAFDRFLARLFLKSNPLFVLKGGYAMELRLQQARATRDIDLTCLLRSSSSPILDEKLISRALRDLSSTDLGDYFSFQVGTPKKELDNAP